MAKAGVLAGVKVLDLSRVLAGPWATQILGDFGADVIKVERAGVGDETRQWGPPYWKDQSAYFLSANRNKRSIFADFNRPEELEHIRQLARRADVVVENYKQGGLDKFALDAESLLKLNPRLIYCSIRGFSSEGPYADLPGYDALIQSMSGLMSITGPDAKTPTKVGVAVSDLLTGLYCNSAVLAALHKRAETGVGQKIEVSLFETQVACLANVMMNHLVSGKVPQPLGNAHPSIVPYRTFQAEDALLLIAVGNDRQFKSLCKALQADWHKDAEFATNPERVKNREVLEAQIAEKISQKTRDEWLQLFASYEFPHGPVNDFADVLKDPHVESTGLIRKMSDSSAPCVANPIRFSETPIQNYRSPPAKSCGFEAVDWL